MAAPRMCASCGQWHVSGETCAEVTGRPALPPRAAWLVELQRRVDAAEAAAIARYMGSSWRRGMV